MSLRSFILIAFAVITSITTIKSDRYKTMVVGGGDSWGYYSYIPAVFLYGDLATLQSTIAVRQSYKPHSVIQESDGYLRADEAPKHGKNNVIKYTYGVSVFLMPAFLAGHVVASVSDTYPADGYSIIYILFLYLIIVFYVTVGLYYLAKYLDNYVPVWVSSMSILTIALGTNLLYFSTVNNVMSHPIQFMLWALLLYHTHRYFREGRNIVSLLGMSLSIGFICIIRPVELFCVLIPLLYSLSKGASDKSMLQEFFTPPYLKHLFIAFGIGLLVLLPQIIYWYTLTGDVIYDSYPAEKFDFTDPKLLAGLFSFKNGFFAYSPVMLLSMIGLVLGLRKEKKLMMVTLVIFGLHAYISYSWWCWNYINGFGSRIMVDILPILALPLSYFIWTISKRWKWVYLLIMIPFIGLNIMHTWQQHKGYIYSEFGSLDFMRQTFGATTHELEHSVAFDLGMYQYDDYNCNETIYFNDFENDDTLSAIEYIEEGNSKYFGVTDSVSSDFGTIFISNESLKKDGEYQHIQLDFDLYILHQISSMWSSTVIYISYKKDGQAIEGKNLRLFNKTGEGTERSFWWGKPGVTSNVTAYISPTDLVEEGADIEILFYKPQGTPVVYIDNYKISFCQR